MTEGRVWWLRASGTRHALQEIWPALAWGGRVDLVIDHWGEGRSLVAGVDGDEEAARRHLDGVDEALDEFEVAQSLWLEVLEGLDVVVETRPSPGG